MPTVKQRLEMRADYAKRNEPFRCSECGGSLHHSFNIVDGKPAHFSCSGVGRVKGPEKWEIAKSIIGAESR